MNDSAGGQDGTRRTAQGSSAGAEFGRQAMSQASMARFGNTKVTNFDRIDYFVGGFLTRVALALVLVDDGRTLDARARFASWWYDRAWDAFDDESTAECVVQDADAWGHELTSATGWTASIGWTVIAVTRKLFSPDWVAPLSHADKLAVRRVLKCASAVLDAPGAASRSEQILAAYVWSEDRLTDDERPWQERSGDRLLALEREEPLSGIGEELLCSVIDHRVGGNLVAAGSEPSEIRGLLAMLRPRTADLEWLDVEVKAWRRLMYQSPITDGWAAMAGDVRRLQARIAELCSLSPSRGDGVEDDEVDEDDKTATWSHIVDLVLLCCDALVSGQRFAAAWWWLRALSLTEGWTAISGSGRAADLEAIEAALDTIRGGGVELDAEFARALVGADQGRSAAYLALHGLAEEDADWPNAAFLGAVWVAYLAADGAPNPLLARAFFPGVNRLLANGASTGVPLALQDELIQLNEVAKAQLGFLANHVFGRRSDWWNREADVAW